MSNTTRIDGGSCTQGLYVEPPVNGAAGELSATALRTQGDASDVLVKLKDSAMAAVPTTDGLVEDFVDVTAWRRGFVSLPTPQSLATGIISDFMVAGLRSMFERHADGHIADSIERALDRGDHEWVQGMLIGLSGVEQDEFDCLYPDATEYLRDAYGTRQRGLEVDPKGYRDAERAFQQVHQEFMAGACAAVEGWDDEGRDAAFQAGRTAIEAMMQDPTRQMEAQAFVKAVLSFKQEGREDQVRGRVDSQRLRNDAAYRSGVHAAERQLRTNVLWSVPTGLEP